MQFTVTYRGADGAVTTEAVEAASRGACFAQMKARGITPMGVKEGAPSRKDMARKGKAKSSRAPKGAGRAPSNALTWILVALALILIGGGVWWWLASHEKAIEQDGGPKKLGALAKEVTPAKAKQALTNATDMSNGKAEAHVVRINGEEPPPGLLPGEPWRVGRKKVHKVRYVARNTNTVHRNATEQMILDTFTIDLGDPPLPLTELPKEELDNIIGILCSPNRVTAEDSEEIKVGKEVLEKVKKEMLKFIKEGGKPEEFFSYYHGILAKAHQKRTIATEEIYKVLEEQSDPEIARQMLKKVNNDLRAEGIKPLPIPISAILRKEEELKK